jgi:hypothetical protein
LGWEGRRRRCSGVGFLEDFCVEDEGRVVDEGDVARGKVHGEVGVERGAGRAAGGVRVGRDLAGHGGRGVGRRVGVIEGVGHVAVGVVEGGVVRGVVGVVVGAVCMGCAVGGGVLRLARLHLGEEVAGSCCGLVQGHVELLFGEEAVEGVGGGFELGVDGARFGLAVGRADAELDAAGGARRLLVLLEELPLALVLGGHFLRLAKLVAGPACLARRLGTAGAGGVPDAELVGVEEHGVAVREVQLLLFALEPGRPRLYACHEALAHRGCEQLVLLFGDLDLVKVRVLDFVLRRLVLVLSLSALF